MLSGHSLFPCTGGAEGGSGECLQPGQEQGQSELGLGEIMSRADQCQPVALVGWLLLFSLCESF